MANYEYEHSVNTTASPSSILSLWCDPTGWPRWDSSVSVVELDGPYQAGTTGTLHLVGQDPVRFRLTEVDPAGGFTDETEIPGGVLRFVHRVTRRPDGGAVVTQRVEIDGPAEMAAGFGPMVTEDVPHAMAALVALAERRAAAAANGAAAADTASSTA